MLDRVQLKLEAREVVRSAKVSAYLFTLLALVLTLILNGASDYMTMDDMWAYDYSLRTGLDLSFLALHPSYPTILVLFVSVVASLTCTVLGAGEVLYHLGVRRGEEMPYTTLFDGFSFAGKIILLSIVQYIFIFLWSLLFIVPGIIAAYRYRFALYNLCENPEMGVMEALNMSKAQTLGFKGQLFVLDLSFIGWYLLSGLTAGILLIWLAPYRMQTDMGYFRQIKNIKGIGYFPEQPHPEDDGTFHTNDPFGGADNSQW